MPREHEVRDAGWGNVSWLESFIDGKLLVATVERAAVNADFMTASLEFKNRTILPAPTSNYWDSRPLNNSTRSTPGKTISVAVQSGSLGGVFSDHKTPPVAQSWRAMSWTSTSTPSLLPPRHARGVCQFPGQGSFLQGECDLQRVRREGWAWAGFL